MPLELWLAFVAASAVLLAIPGPAAIPVLTHALTRCRKVALATAGGVAIGDVITMSASLPGLGALVPASGTREKMRRPSTRLWPDRTGGGALIGMGSLTATLRRA